MRRAVPAPTGRGTTGRRATGRRAGASPWRAPAGRRGGRSSRRGGDARDRHRGRATGAADGATAARAPPTWSRSSRSAAASSAAPSATCSAVAGVSPRRRTGRDPRPRGRVGLRQVDAPAGCCCNLIRPTSGDGAASTAMRSQRPDGAQDAGRCARRLQIVFQDPYASLNPRMTVGEILAEPLKVHHELGQRPRTPRTRSSELLAIVGLSPEHAQPLPARVLRRPAPARRHRPGPGPRARR